MTRLHFLWLRKNNRVGKINNQDLGKKIQNKIIELGGKQVEPIEKCIWGNPAENIGEFELPIDAHQFNVPIDSISKIYEWLESL